MTSDFTLKVNSASSPRWDIEFDVVHPDGKADWEADEEDSYEI